MLLLRERRNSQTVRLRLRSCNAICTTPVVTNIKGTPLYMAPSWFRSVLRPIVILMYLMRGNLVCILAQLCLRVAIFKALWWDAPPLNTLLVGRKRPTFRKKGTGETIGDKES